MIAGTFAISGLLLLITAYLFAAGFLTPVTQTIAWFSIFFFASAAASSAYLTASEIFPLETRALAIACFYALGTAIGGSTSPLLFGWLIESGSAWRVSAGYALAAALLLIAAGTELMLGIDAEGKSLESIADPLSSWFSVPRCFRTRGAKSRAQSHATSYWPVFTSAGAVRSQRQSESRSSAQLATSRFADEGSEDLRRRCDHH